jgi:hypothetical protein
MKIFISFASLIVAIKAPITVTASVRKIPNSGLRHLSGGTTNDNEICFPSPKSYSQPEIVLLHSLASHIADDSWTGVTPPGEPVPQYTVGCGWFDFKCYVCELCEKIYGDLVDTGSDVACDAACVGIAEVAGGGPEDRT